ncbi:MULTISPECIES: hypothetical protein [unclassified Pseudomonas]|uniref:hypothetical protein n=1 Tax=unclassified Pseudomonas TaxID=196821 RepID=UPI0011798F45|nr:MULTISPECIES: hypothetical protein [unclassified Pseudomonas]
MKIIPLLMLSVAFPLAASAADPGPSPASHPTPNAEKLAAEKEAKAANDRLREAEAHSATKAAMDGADWNGGKPPLPTHTLPGGPGGKPQEKQNE